MKTFQEFLIEAKYEVEVEVRDASKANDIAKDMFRGKYKQDGSNSFIFKDEDSFEEFKDELKSQGLKLLAEARKVNTGSAANAARKVIDTIDKFESTVVDMQDQDIINTKIAKRFDKAAKEMRNAISDIEGSIY